jgi:chromate transporter
VITVTFVGYLVQGIPGAAVATTAVFLPSFLILIGVAPWFDKMRASARFASAVAGVLRSFVGLLFAVTVRFALNVQWDLPHLALWVAAFAALLLKLDILWVVLGAAAISAFVF